MEKRLLTVNEGAEVLNVPISKVYQLVRSKNFPSLKVGGVWRIDSQKMDRWIDKQIQVKDSYCLLYS
jgi:excisionase family DNA binding protein